MENSTSKDIGVLLCKAHSTGRYWIFASAINFLLSITATLWNALILIALHKESSLHPPSKLLYRCLAVTDILVGLISEPSTAVYNTFLVSSEHRFHGYCFYTASISTVSFTILSAVSLVTMTTISVDRLLALLLGLRYRQIVTLRRVRVLVLLFWTTSIAFASMSFWNYTIAKTYNYTLILLCIFISAFCYWKIFRTLRQHQIQVQHHEEPASSGAALQDNARYRKTVFTAMWVEFTLVACYLPYSIVIAIITSHGSSPFLDVVWELTGTLVYLNSSLNPLLYFWKIQEVRQEVKNTIRQFLCLFN